MGFGMNEVPYAPEVRKRNQVVIAALAVGAVAAILVTPVFTTWPLMNALASAAIALGFCGCLYWMFASKKAGYLQAPTNWKTWRKRMHLR